MTRIDNFTGFLNIGARYLELRNKNPMKSLKPRGQAKTRNSCLPRLPRRSSVTQCNFRLREENQNKHIGCEQPSFVRTLNPCGGRSPLEHWLQRTSSRPRAPSPLKQFHEGRSSEEPRIGIQRSQLRRFIIKRRSACFRVEKTTFK